MTDDLREYRAEACSTDVFGRVLCNAREQHFVIDDPIWNGCLGEALTPGEAFLAAVAACGVELARAQVIAAGDGVAIGVVEVRIHGIVDREHPVREDLTVFNRVRMRFNIEGLSDEQAKSVVERVAQRCPLYGWQRRRVGGRVRRRDPDKLNSGARRAIRGAPAACLN